jgi:MFS family permease
MPNAPEPRYRWIIVAAGGLIGCVAIGAMFSLPVLLTPMVRDTGWSLAGVSAAMTIGFITMAVGSMGWGALSDRVGPRPVVMIGSLIVPMCLVLAARAPSLIVFQIVFGMGLGIGCSAIFAPMMACVTGWFETQRSLAVSLVSAGFGLAPMTMSPLAAVLMTSTHDWRRTLLIIAVVVVSLMVPASLLVRRPPALASPPAVRPGANADDGADTSTMAALRSPRFLILVLTNFFCCATHSGPIIHTVSFALTCGIPMTAAVSIYSVEGFAGMFGRIGFGVLGDRFGAKRVLVVGLLAQAFGALGYIMAGSLFGFYVAASVFGFIYAGVMPLYAVLARENFPLRMMGTVIGGTAMAGSLGMATGPLAGGLLFQALGTYRWLYLGSFAMGLGAFLVALMFKGAARTQAIGR